MNQSGVGWIAVIFFGFPRFLVFSFFFRGRFVSFFLDFFLFIVARPVGWFVLLLEKENTCHRFVSCGSFFSFFLLGIRTPKTKNNQSESRKRMNDQLDWKRKNQINNSPPISYDTHTHTPISLCARFVSLQNLRFFKSPS